jgi:hypothetical protein
MISNLIKDGVVAIGEMKLGILCPEVTTHSIRCRAAMAMYLAGVPIFSIMLIGLVQQRFPEVHQKTGSRILSRYLIKNDRGSVLQTYQKNPIQQI